MVLLCAATACSRAESPFPLGAITIEEDRLEVWVADESDERRQGLRHIEELPPGVDGMLFVFPDPLLPGFHMEDTLIPLDIWWFDPEMTLIGVSEMEPCTQSPCTIYRPPGEVRWALETVRGQFDFDPGDRLSIVETG